MKLSEVKTMEDLKKYCRSRINCTECVVDSFFAPKPCRSHGDEAVLEKITIYIRKEKLKKLLA